jgi:hypothetical protein
MPPRKISRKTGRCSRIDPRVDQKSTVRRGLRGNASGAFAARRSVAIEGAGLLPMRAVELLQYLGILHRQARPWRKSDCIVIRYL